MDSAAQAARESMAAKLAEPSEAQRYFDALRRIARDFQSSDQLRRRAGQYGLSHKEELEMAYENIQQIAEIAIKGRRRPR